MTEKKTLGLYLHIPFCVRKCRYCDFLSFPSPGEVREKYLDALRSEIQAAAYLYGDRPVDTVFIGGGTPSVLPAEAIAELLDTAGHAFMICPDAEVTVEMNPGAAWTEEEMRMLMGREAVESGTPARVRKEGELRSTYVNRWSVGLQSVHEEELAVLGRIHTFRDFEETYADLRRAGADNINVDLMFGIPGQTRESWEETLRTVINMAPEHISAYSLIIEEGTPFYEAYQEGQLALPDEETEREMAHRAVHILAEEGYRQYEISNFAKPGFESRHNTRYWRRSDYLGLGLGAASLIDNVRWSNTRDLKEYLSRTIVQSLQGIRREEQVLSLREQMEEFLFLGLRMTKGVSLCAFEEQFGRTVFKEYGEEIRKYVEAGLLTLKTDRYSDSRLCLTSSGMDISNVILADFIHET